jgi:hypothetical protein
MEGRPASQRSGGTLSQTLESSDHRLAASLFMVAALPNASNYRAAAIEYRRLGVLDKSFEYFDRAAALDPTDARFARRHGADSGETGGHRSWDSERRTGPSITRPTLHPLPIRWALCFRRSAVSRKPNRWYRTAWTLDPNGWYALNNLCYVQILRRNAVARAIPAVRHVGVAGADGRVPKNNLALAHAAAGDLCRWRSNGFRRCERSGGSGLQLRNYS